MDQTGAGAATKHFFNWLILWTKWEQELLLNIFSTDPFCGPNVGAAPEHFFNRLILWTTQEQELLPNIFSTDWFCGPNGSRCCYPKFQLTNLWIQNRVGTANQNFYRPTNQFVDQCCYPKKISTNRPICGPMGAHTNCTHWSIIPKTQGISSSVNDQLYHEHQLSPLAPYTTVHYVTLLFGLILTRWANICGKSSKPSNFQQFQWA